VGKRGSDIGWQGWDTHHDCRVVDRERDVIETLRSRNGKGVEDVWCGR
jgi:hypothetical protein